LRGIYCIHNRYIISKYKRGSNMKTKTLSLKLGSAAIPRSFRDNIIIQVLNTGPNVWVLTGEPSHRGNYFQYGLCGTQRPREDIVEGHLEGSGQLH